MNGSSKSLLAFLFLSFNLNAAVIVVGANRDARHNNDADLIKSVAEQNGQSFYDVRSAPKPEDLRAKFEQAVKEAVANLKPGEPLVIQFTGHGLTADPRDPKLSGTTTGNGQMVSYQAYASILSKYTTEEHKIKLISTACFGGGVHHVSRELNKLKPGSACSVSTTAHSFTSNVRNQDEEPTVFTQNFWSAIQADPNTNMAKAFSTSATGLEKSDNKNAFNNGFTSLGSTDSLEFYNKTGVHSKEFSDEMYSKVGASANSWSAASGVRRADSEDGYASSNLNRIFSEEFGELEAHKKNYFSQIFNLADGAAKNFYKEIETKEYGRKQKEEYVPYVGEFFDWKWDVDGDLDVTDSYSLECYNSNRVSEEVNAIGKDIEKVVSNLGSQGSQNSLYKYSNDLKRKYEANKTSYAREITKWKNELEKTVTEYAKEKRVLVDRCIQTQWDGRLTDNTRSQCSYIKDRSTSQHNKDLAELERKYREKFNRLRDLDDYPKLAELRFIDGEAQKMERISNAYKDTKSTDKRIVDGIHECEQTPLLKS